MPATEYNLTIATITQIDDDTKCHLCHAITCCAVVKANNGVAYKWCPECSAAIFKALQDLHRAAAIRQALRRASS